MRTNRIEYPLSVNRNTLPTCPATASRQSSPQFDLLDDKGIVIPIRLDDIQAIIPPMDIP
jgi:hypothetical protein